MRERYVWFDRVRVASDSVLALHCIVNERKVPLPLALLHPECRLRKAGDVGRLGVPRAWAIGWGLVSPSS
jgi:hypothetical protein